ncbi:shikimate kinase [Eggerthellaceae bacterium 3-80]|nr:shikimate kinase [bacterium D16-34]
MELYELTRPVFFVGFMGAGKTSVSRKLARTFGLAAVDMDTYIERREGRKVKEIFAQAGEEGFRDIEQEVLVELSQKDPLLVSCGGGVIKRKENRETLKEAGFVIHLRITADEAKSRIGDLSTRPLFSDIENARDLAESRMPLYDEVADVAIDTAGRGVSAIAYEVRDVLEKAGVLCRQQK